MLKKAVRLEIKSKPAIVASVSHLRTQHANRASQRDRASAAESSMSGECVMEGAVRPSTALLSEQASNRHVRVSGVDGCGASGEGVAKVRTG